MKYVEAEEMGRACGLEEPAEFVNNVFIHSLNLFAYTDRVNQLLELRADAEGKVDWSHDCGDAIPLGSDISRPCPMCANIRRLNDAV